MEMIITDEIKRKIADHNHANPYTDITPFALQVSWPIVYYQGFHPDADELLVYAVPAATFKDKTQTVGYTGKSGGVSVRVAKGVTVRSGASGGRAVKGTVRQTNDGDLLITSKRIIFIGKDDSFEFPFNKISAVKMIDGSSFVILAGNSSRNIALNSKLSSYAYAIIDYVRGVYAQGQDVYASIRSDQSKVTPDQIETCARVRQECAQMRPSGGKRSAGCLKYLLIGILGALVLFLVFGVLLYSCSSGFSDTGDATISEVASSSVTSQYSSDEIVYMDNHPVIYDTFESAEDFYKGIDNVKTVDVKEFTQIWKEYSWEDNKTVLYFIKDSTDEKYIGSLYINLYDDAVTSNMTVDTAAALMVTYLPDDFFDYYTKDSSYKRTNDNWTDYVYSCRLNDAGVEYSNNGHGQYSYYYSFTFSNNSNNGQWVLHTSNEAYGGTGLEWIQKYGEDWDVDLADYK